MLKVRKNSFIGKENGSEVSGLVLTACSLCSFSLGLNDNNDEAFVLPGKIVSIADLVSSMHSPRSIFVIFSWK